MDGWPVRLAPGFFGLGPAPLSQRPGPLLAQVTAFTVAHTLTLALSSYGVVRLSPRVVEPLIALSIVYVAVENVEEEGEGEVDELVNSCCKTVLRRVQADG